jgi:mannose-6-phosphate isomerase class I
MKSNYQKHPFVAIDGAINVGWDAVAATIRQEYEQSQKKNFIVAVETYQGVYFDELAKGLSLSQPAIFFSTEEILLPEDKIRDITFPDVTEDRIFGYITRLQMSDLIDWKKIVALRENSTGAEGLKIIYGYGASLVEEKPDLIIYADMARWEIQRRQRSRQINNIGIINKDEDPVTQYKRGFFVDWRICDKLKKTLFDRANYWLDVNQAGKPKMISAGIFLSGLTKTAQQPFRVVPFFDPGLWGGHWMQEKFDLDEKEENYAWCFDCVPEENSLLFKIGDELFELPSINVVFYQAKALLGEPVWSRFGEEFPIRFDFLDTMNGGNLSLQVHPTTSYIQEVFGMKYTQDESYYLLDAAADASVFLGLKENINPQDMISDLLTAQSGDIIFDTEKYINSFPAKRHDHFLIPNGTIHCSGVNSMVLEVSATPYIFTFKLWDWNRLGLDGKPRPINIRHGINVIQWDRTTAWCKEQLVNRMEKIAEGDGWTEERTGLHKNEFIETRRHWFTKTVAHETNGSVNVLNLVEGDEALVESPENNFEPFAVHYAETFIVPSAVGKYTIRPSGKSEGKTCATLKAFVRLNA